MVDLKKSKKLKNYLIKNLIVTLIVTTKLNLIVTTKK